MLKAFRSTLTLVLIIAFLSAAQAQDSTSEALARILNIDEKTITGMRQTRQAQGRFVYEWKPEAKAVSYMIVISRPYLLSFYDKDPKRVAWTVMAAYESSCEE